MNNDETKYIGYTTLELAEMAAHMERKALATRWASRTHAERDAHTALAGLANKWRARAIRATVEARLEAISRALGAEPEPFLLQRPARKLQQATRRRPARAFVSQAVAAALAVFG